MAELKFEVRPSFLCHLDYDCDPYFTFFRIAWTRLQKILLCEVASFQAIYRTRSGAAEEKTSSGSNRFFAAISRSALLP